MLPVRVRSSLLVLAASVGLAGCSTYGPFGGVSVGYGSGYGYDGYGYDRYGYDRYGYGSPYGYGNYGGYGYYGGYDPYYGYGYGYRPSYYGWNGGYYYPGTGYYVYDRDGRRQRWTNTQKSFWESRGPGVTVRKENWTGYKPDSTSRQRLSTRSIETQSVSPQRGVVRVERRAERSAERQAVRTESRRSTERRRDRPSRSNRDED